MVRKLLNIDILLYSIVITYAFRAPRINAKLDVTVGQVMNYKCEEFVFFSGTTKL